MKGWFVLLIAYVVVITVTVGVIASRPEKVDWVAMRRLPANHLVAPSDLKEPRLANALGVRVPDSKQLEGRYVIKEVSPGERVRLSNLSTDPLIRARPAESLFWLSLSELAAAGALVDVGYHLDLCVSGTTRMTPPPSKTDQEKKTPEAGQESGTKAEQPGATDTKGGTQRIGSATKPADDRSCVRGEVAAFRCDLRDAKSSPTCNAGIWIKDAERSRIIAADKTKVVIFVVPATR